MRADIKIQITWIIIILCLATSQSSAVEFAGGTGEPNNPYQIATAEQLISIGNDPNLLDKHFLMVNDIDLDPNLPDGQVFIQAVITPDILNGFTGNFNGNSHKITNLTIRKSTDGFFCGLFGMIEKEGKVCNLALEDIYINADILYYTGGLAGQSNGTIDNCYITGSISCKEGGNIGGLVGYNRGSIEEAPWIRPLGVKGIITNCYSTVNIACEDNVSSVGGIAGGAWGGKIINCCTSSFISGGIDSSSLGGLVGQNDSIINCCFSIGNVSGGNESLQIGGLVGINLSAGGEITNCYSTASVLSGDNSINIGGLVGSNLLGINSGGRITNCYSIGRVSGGENSRNLGGLVGYGHRGISACFWDIETSGLTNMCGIQADEAIDCDDSYGKTTFEMQMADTFLEAGWDFDDIWMVCEGVDYPRLQWQDVRCGE